MRSWWTFGVAVPFIWIAACGNNGNNFGPVGSVGGNNVNGDDGGGDGGGGIVIPTGDDASLSLTGGDSTVTGGSDSLCKGGHYDGTFAGSYTSHLTLVGIPLTVTGNVDMTLEQEGTAQMTCMLVGEATKCSDLFSLQNGTITGVANGDDAGGGFPYYCTMTGTLDCPAKKLVNGWIQCTYCVGPLADGGMSCAFLNLGGTSGITMGVGGQFAGPLTANYNTGTTSFVLGTWNGAESLAGNDGGSPGPDGGPVSSYLSDSGYGLLDFGGSGTWNATYHP
jgi:hypothetical protein